MEKKEKIFFTLKLSIPIFFVLLILTAGITTGIITFEKPIQKTTKDLINVELTISFSENKYFYQEYEVEQITVLGLLLKTEQNNDIKIKKTYWEQYDSYIIDSISIEDIEYRSDSNHYWGFYINGEVATQGADQIYIKNNDLIEWKYESF